MSKGYTFRCLSHSETCAVDINHGEERLKILWLNRYVLKQANQSLFIGFNASYPEDEILDFVYKHINCEMVTVSEYGDELKRLPDTAYQVILNSSPT